MSWLQPQQQQPPPPPQPPHPQPSKLQPPAPVLVRDGRSSSGFPVEADAAGVLRAMKKLQHPEKLRVWSCSRSGHFQYLNGIPPEAFSGDNSLRIRQPKCERLMMMPLLVVDNMKQPECFCDCIIEREATEEEGSLVPPPPNPTFPKLRGAFVVRKYIFSRFRRDQIDVAVADHVPILRKLGELYGHKAAGVI